jgi:hypothetical protein
MHTANQCTPTKIANGAENLILQALKLQHLQFLDYVTTTSLQTFTYTSRQYMDQALESAVKLRKRTNTM